MARRGGLVTGVLVGLLGVLGGAELGTRGAASAQSDPFVAEANRETRLVRGNTAVEAELFPLIASMDPCPLAVDSHGSLRAEPGLAYPGTETWDASVEWAARDAQQAVLDKMAELTDPDVRTMISLPIGREGVDEAWIERGLFIELGPEGLLNGLDAKYLDVFREVHALSVIDAKRLIESGDDAAGLMRMVDLIRLYRIVRARPVLEEQLESQELMAIAAEHLRDIVRYFDAEAKLTSVALVEAVQGIGEDVLRLERARFPSVPEIAAEQLLARTYERQGGVDRDEFALALSRLSVRGIQPLMLFNEAARFRFEAPRQADWFDVDEMQRDVFANLATRWEYDINDEDLAKVPSTQDTMIAERFRVIEAASQGLEKLVPYRRTILVHMAGTRLSLATVAYRIARRGDMPRILPNLQPRFIDDIDNNLDYFGYDYDSQRNADFLYFVPGSDESKPQNVSARDAFLYEQPHQLQVRYADPELDLPGLGLTGAVEREGFEIMPLAFFLAELEDFTGFSTGELAEFPPRWFTLDEDGDRPGTSVEGSPPPPLIAVNGRAELIDVQQRPGEILIVISGAGDDSNAQYNPRDLALFSRLGFRYHFDGVRVVVVGGDYADEKRSPAELRIFAARTARQVGVFDIHFFDEDSEIDDRWGLDDDSDPTFIIDRNGIVRAAGVQFRHLEEALQELLAEQPVEPMLDSLRESLGFSPSSSGGLPTSLNAEVGQDDFVLYSRGKNLRDDREFLQPHVIDEDGRELLFWPPVLSLQREAR